MSSVQQHCQSQLSDTEKPPAFWGLLVLNRSWKRARLSHLWGSVPSGAGHRAARWHSAPKLPGKAEMQARERSTLPLVSFPRQAWLLQEGIFKGHGTNRDRPYCSRRPLAPQQKWHLKCLFLEILVTFFCSEWELSRILARVWELSKSFCPTYVLAALRNLTDTSHVVSHPLPRAKDVQ